MATYTRRIRLSDPDELQPGDLVDISTDTMPTWATVDYIGTHGDDGEADDHCADEDHCDLVVFFTGDDDPPWHVLDTDDVYARLLATDDQAAVDAENAAPTRRGGAISPDRRGGAISPDRTG